MQSTIFSFFYVVRLVHAIWNVGAIRNIMTQTELKQNKLVYINARDALIPNSARTVLVYFIYDLSTSELAGFATETRKYGVGENLPGVYLASLIPTLPSSYFSNSSDAFFFPLFRLGEGIQHLELNFAQRCRCPGNTIPPSRPPLP